MSQKLLLAWAVSATALMLVALGFALGNYANRAPAVSTPGSAYVLPDVGTDTGGDRDAAADTPRYAVPPEYAGLPTEWRTEHDDAFRGYAILLDPTRRELIVEQCRHAGYIDKESGEPVPEGWELCHVVLWGTLAQFSDDGALAVDRSGRPVDVAMRVGGDAAMPQLALEFNGHSMILIPGSKNELLQAIEADPEIRRQRREWVRQKLAAEDAPRVQEDRRADVPRYTLPDGGTKDTGG